MLFEARRVLNLESSGMVVSAVVLTSLILLIAYHNAKKRICFRFIGISDTVIVGAPAAIRAVTMSGK